MHARFTISMLNETHSTGVWWEIVSFSIQYTFRYVEVISGAILCKCYYLEIVIKFYWRRGRNTQAKESTMDLKPRADVIISPKEGYQWPHKKE